MSTATKIILAFLSVIVLSVAFSGCATFSFYNEAVKLENGLKAHYKDNQNNYSNYFNKIKEMAQVPDMYTGDLEKVYRSVMEGRYGKDGSKAMLQFIQEKNPNFDSKVYLELQRTIAAGRESFEANQRTLLDKKLVLENKLETGLGIFLAGPLGLPKTDLSEYDIVTNAETEEAFKTKKAGPIKLK